jgi:hypothetical protein
MGGEENLSRAQIVTASGVAGSVSGMVGGMLRKSPSAGHNLDETDGSIGGPRNIIPGMIFFGTLGTGSSAVAQYFKNKETKPTTSWLESKWSPLKRLSDEDYIARLQEQQLRIQAELEILDEHIAALKSSNGRLAKEQDGSRLTKN